MAGSADKDVILVGEPDYQYGRGSLRLRVESVDRENPVTYDGETWYRVEGVQLSASGVEMGRRNVLIRGRRLPPAFGRSTG